MIGNIESTKAMIERMSPDQLRQFAMMHQDDMIAMSLVSSVQSMRNKEKIGQQAQQANATPPKVNEQLINSIQPEQSGIASLPAENMTYAADGGIVGYQSGGGVESTDTIESSLLDTQRVDAAARDKKIKELEAKARFLRDVGAPQASQAEEELATYTQLPRPISKVPQDKKIQLPPPPPPKAMPRAARPQAPEAAPPEAAPAPAKSIDDLYNEAEASAGVGKTTDPYAAKREENAALLRAQNEEELADAKTRQAGLMSLMKPREERIAKREAALEAQGETDKAMAIINAGLAMMQSTGKGFSGIAAGATEGMKQYGASMALSKAERQKIGEARDAYDEFKFNAESMSQKEITSGKRKIVEGTIAASEKAIQAIMERENISRAEAAEKFKAMVKQSQEAAQMASTEKIAREGNLSREKIANIRTTPGPSEAKPITYNEAADNISKWMESMAGMNYISKIQKEAKAAGKPVPDAMEIRNVLIQREMGRQPTAPPQASTSGGWGQMSVTQ